MVVDMSVSEVKDTVLVSKVCRWIDECNAGYLLQMSNSTCTKPIHQEAGREVEDSYSMSISSHVNHNISATYLTTYYIRVPRWSKL